MSVQSGKQDLTWLGMAEAVTTSIDARLVASHFWETIAVVLCPGDAFRWIETIRAIVSPSELFLAFQQRVIGVVTGRDAEGKLTKAGGLRVQPTLILLLLGETRSPIVKAEIWKICIHRIFRLIDHQQLRASVITNVTPVPARANVAS